jgi:PAS domain S-box-containing protein
VGERVRDEPERFHRDPVDMAAVPSPVRDDAAQLLEGVIAHTADAVICTDDSQRIRIFNPAAEHVFGYCRDEVVGKPVDCLLPRSARGAMRPWFDGVMTETGVTSEHVTCGGGASRASCFRPSRPSPG